MRSSELGDGTLEARELPEALAYNPNPHPHPNQARELPEALAYLDLFVGGPELLTQAQP